MALKHTRRALHEALDLLVDALEADARATGEKAPELRRKGRRAPRYAPLPDESETTPEMRAAMARRL